MFPQFILFFRLVARRVCSEIRHPLETVATHPRHGLAATLHPAYNPPKKNRAYMSCLRRSRRAGATLMLHPPPDLSPQGERGGPIATGHATPPRSDTIPIMQHSNGCPSTTQAKKGATKPRT